MMNSLTEGLIPDDTTGWTQEQFNDYYEKRRQQREEEIRQQAREFYEKYVRKPHYKECPVCAEMNWVCNEVCCNCDRKF